MEYKRPYYYTLKERIKSRGFLIQAITGPRQVGKTTLVKQLCNDIDIPYMYVSADNVLNGSATWLEQQWEAARIKLKTDNSEEILLIVDEIQKIKNWSETVKKYWDTDRFNNTNVKVILLGSSGLLLQQGLNESLAGRFELINMPHWSFTEMSECFGISAEQYAWFGAYPGAVAFIDDEPRWKDYIKNSLIEATISKDILMLTKVGKPALMKQVFEMGVHYSSKILSYSKMLGQLQDAGNTVTIAHYLNLLDTAGLLTGIPKFFSEKFRQKASSPKWQVKNTALFSALSEYNYNEIKNDTVKWGQIIESVIGAHLINGAIKNEYKVFYWRHKNDEVDFVLQKGGKIIGIEVKSGARKPTKGIHVFKNKYNPDKILLVGIQGTTWQDFIKINPGDLF